MDIKSHIVVSRDRCGGMVLPASRIIITKFHRAGAENNGFSEFVRPA